MDEYKINNTSQYNLHSNIKISNQTIEIYLVIYFLIFQLKIIGDRVNYSGFQFHTSISASIVNIIIYYILILYKFRLSQMKQIDRKRNKIITILNLTFTAISFAATVAILVIHFVNNKFNYMSASMPNLTTSTITYGSNKYKFHLTYLAITNMLLFLAIVSDIIIIILIVGLFKKSLNENYDYLNATNHRLKIIGLLFININLLAKAIIFGYILSFYLDLNLTCANPDCEFIYNYQASFLVEIIISGILLFFQLLNFVSYMMIKVNENEKKYQSVNEMNTNQDLPVQNYNPQKNIYTIQQIQLNNKLREQNKLRDYSTKNPMNNTYMQKKQNQLEFQLKKNSIMEDQRHISKNNNIEESNDDLYKPPLKVRKIDPNIEFTALKNQNSKLLQQPFQSNQIGQIGNYAEKNKNNELINNSLLPEIQKQNNGNMQRKLNQTSFSLRKSMLDNTFDHQNFSKKKKSKLQITEFNRNEKKVNEMTNLNDFLKQQKDWNEQKDQILKEIKDSNKLERLNTISNKKQESRYEKQQTQYNPNQKQMNGNYYVVERKNKIPDIQKIRMLERKNR